MQACTSDQCVWREAAWSSAGWAFPGSSLPCTASPWRTTSPAPAARGWTGWRTGLNIQVSAKNRAQRAGRLSSFHPAGTSVNWEREGFHEQLLFLKYNLKSRKVYAQQMAVATQMPCRPLEEFKGIPDKSCRLSSPLVQFHIYKPICLALDERNTLLDLPVLSSLITTHLIIQLYKKKASNCIEHEIQLMNLDSHRFTQCFQIFWGLCWTSATS